MTTEEGLEFARKNNFLFLETSALDTTNIELAFFLLAKRFNDQEATAGKKNKIKEKASSKVDTDQSCNCF